MLKASDFVSKLALNGRSENLKRQPAVLDQTVNSFSKNKLI